MLRAHHQASMGQSILSQHVSLGKTAAKRYRYLDRGNLANGVALLRQRV